MIVCFDQRDAFEKPRETPSYEIILPSFISNAHTRTIRSRRHAYTEYDANEYK